MEDLPQLYIGLEIGCKTYKNCFNCTWTWPQFKYTTGWASGATPLALFFLGTTSVCRPTGHCGRPAFNSSRHRSNCLGVGDRDNPSADLHRRVAPQRSINVPSFKTLFSVWTCGPWTAALRDSLNPNTSPPTCK